MRTALRERVNRLQPRKMRRLAIGTVDLRSEPLREFACFGCDERTLFEVGSVSKGVTGLLLGSAIERGVLTFGTRLDELAPTLAASQVGDVTIAELATHTSGLPQLGRGLFSLRVVTRSLLGQNPYAGVNQDRILALAARARLRRRGQPQYSNFGASLAGQLLARREGSSYVRLADDQVFGPLGLHDTWVRSTTDPAGRQLRTGRGSTGARRPLWPLDGFAPAGGVVSSIHDLSTLAIHLLKRTAPGIAAIDAVPGVSGSVAGVASGLFWVIDRTASDENLIWHNGLTGGYAAYLAISPERGTAVGVVMDIAFPGEPERLGRAVHSAL